MKGEAAIRASLRSWIVEHGHGVRPERLSDATPLIESGVLRSPQVLDLLLHIEVLRDARITVTSLAPGMFTNIDAIVASFFGEPRVDA